MHNKVWRSTHSRFHHHCWCANLFFNWSTTTNFIDCRTHQLLFLCFGDACNHQWSVSRIYMRLCEKFIKCLERQRGVWWAIMHWFQEPATWRCVNAVAKPLCRTHVGHVGRLNRSKNIDVALIHNGSNHVSTACIWIYVRFERTVTSIVHIWIYVRLRKLLIPHLLRVSKLWSFAKFEYCLARKSPKYQKYRSC